MFPNLKPDKGCVEVRKPQLPIEPGVDQHRLYIYHNKDGGDESHCSFILIVSWTQEDEKHFYVKQQESQLLQTKEVYC